MAVTFEHHEHDDLDLSSDEDVSERRSHGSSVSRVIAGGRDYTMEAFLLRYTKMRNLYQQLEQRGKSLEQSVIQAEQKAKDAENNATRAENHLIAKEEEKESSWDKCAMELSKKKESDEMLTELRRQRHECQKQRDNLAITHENKRYTLKQKYSEHIALEDRAIALGKKLETTNTARLRLKTEIEEVEDETEMYQRQLDAIKSDMAEMRQTIHETIARAEARTNDY